MKIPSQHVPEDFAVCPECGGPMIVAFAQEVGGIDPSSSAVIVPGATSALCVGKKVKHSYDPSAWESTVEKLKSIQPQSP